MKPRISCVAVVGASTGILGAVWVQAHEALAAMFELQAATRWVQRDARG